MRLEPVWEIFRKDLLEIRSSRTSFAALFVLPAIFVLDALLAIQVSAMNQTSGSIDAASNLARAAGLSLDFLLLIPPLLAVVIGTTSIVVEKTNHSLEPLLATPISDSELMWGKGLTPLIPGVLAGWIAYGIVFAIGDAIAWPIIGGPLLPTALGLYQMLVLAPLLGLLGTFAVLVVSSWAKDARTAQQVSMFIVLPIVVGVLIGFLVLPSSLPVVGAFTLGVLAVIWVLTQFAIRRFDRASILVTWR